MSCHSILGHSREAINGRFSLSPSLFLFFLKISNKISSDEEKGREGGRKLLEALRFEEIFKRKGSKLGTAEKKNNVKKDDLDSLDKYINGLQKQKCRAAKQEKKMDSYSQVYLHFKQVSRRVTGIPHFIVLSFISLHRWVFFSPKLKVRCSISKKITT